MVYLLGIETIHFHVSEDARNVLHLDDAILVGVKVAEGRRCQRRLHAELTVLVGLG